LAKVFIYLPYHAKTHRIPISQIARVLNPAAKGRRYVLLLTFFGDESYDKRVFTFGGFMACDTEWDKLECEWDKEVQQAGVSRFHAAPLNGYKEEFETWRDTSKSSDFVKSLINIISNRKMVGFSFAMLLDDYEKYTSPVAKDKLGTPYLCCFKHCIAMAAQEMSEMPPEDKFAVIIDRNPEENEAVKLSIRSRTIPISRIGIDLRPALRVDGKSLLRCNLRT
jgi:hypothetical protein